MNKTIGSLLFLSPLFLLGCNEEPGLKMALGTYTYQASGSARIYDQDTDHAIQVPLEIESGTMSISKGKEANTGVLQVYAYNSYTYELPLIFAHDTIWVDPAYRDIEVTMNGAKELFHIRVGGQGFVLQNGDISIHLGYSGRSRNTDHNYTLTASDVHMNAKKQN